MAKKANESFNLILMIINLPWLLLTECIFKIQMLLSKEDFSNHIEGTTIWISSRPSKHNSLQHFDLVIDLTAEFSKDNHAVNYLCVPNLDAHILQNKTLPNSSYKNKNILIHCANGHGRSSTYAAYLMLKWGLSPTIDQAFQDIKASRKRAIPNKSQRKWAEQQQ